MDTTACAAHRRALHRPSADETRRDSIGGDAYPRMAATNRYNLHGVLRRHTVGGFRPCASQNSIWRHRLHEDVQFAAAIGVTATSAACVVRIIERRVANVCSVYSVTHTWAEMFPSTNGGRTLNPGAMPCQTSATKLFRPPSETIARSVLSKNRRVGNPSVSVSNSLAEPCGRSTIIPMGFAWVRPAFLAAT
jgi:hypothetical protein